MPLYNLLWQIMSLNNGVTEYVTKTGVAEYATKTGWAVYAT